MKITPFTHESFLRKESSALLRKVKEEILGLDNEHVLRVSQTELETYYITENRIRPLALYCDKLIIENRSSTSMIGVQRVSLPGTILDIAIPYEGDERLWFSKPSGFHPRGLPEIEIQNDQVVFTISFSDETVTPEGLKSDLDETVKSLTETVENLRNDVNQHNASLIKEVTEAIGRKRELAQSALGAVSALGIPIKRRDSPLTFVAPIKRRPSPIRKPSVEPQPYQREPVLEETEYNHILRVMRSMSLIIERSPKSFATLDEEAIRIHFLLQLNGHYEGAATAETFNAFGRTDILIRVGSKNVFIAECKFWDGPKAFDKAIDQVLRYLTWRDAKCALLVFNKKKNSVGVSQKMHEAIEKRSEYRRTVTRDPKGDSKYIFVKEPGREITITTQLYDIPLPEK